VKRSLVSIVGLLEATIVATGDGIVEGTDGDDVIVGSPGADTIIAGAGNDIICGAGGADIISGGPGNDVIQGNAGDDVILGNQGRDVIRGGPGNDAIAGGFGKDILFGGPNADIVSGGQGKDIVRGGSGNDTVAGGKGADLVEGGGGDDIVRGGNGNDTLRGSSAEAAAPTADSDFALKILHINDHHSHLNPDSGDLDLAGEGTRVSLGGFPSVVAKMDELAAANADGNVVKIHAGDAVTGTLFHSLFKGEADAALMNEACFDIFELGNHEFDDGDQGLADFLGCAGRERRPGVRHAAERLGRHPVRTVHRHRVRRREGRLRRH